MTRPKRDQFMRYEPAGNGVARRAPITQRNMVSPAKPRDDDDADAFGTSTNQSSIVNTPRDRAPKGVNDGRGKRSVKDVLLSQPNDAARAVYALERIASLEDQIVKILELCTPDAREIIFKSRKSLKQYWDK